MEGVGQWIGLTRYYSAELEPGRQIRAVSFHMQNGLAGWNSCLRAFTHHQPPAHKTTLLFSYFLAPTGCFPFRFPADHFFFSISRLCILLWVLQKYCFFFFLKLSFNQIAPAGMRCQRYSFQWIPAYAALPWQQDSEAEPWP